MGRELLIGGDARLEVVPLEQTDRHWAALKQLVLDSVSSPESKRAYSFALDHFRSWYLADTRASFSKPVVLEYKAALERLGLRALYHCPAHRGDS